MKRGQRAHVSIFKTLAEIGAVPCQKNVLQIKRIDRGKTIVQEHPLPEPVSEPAREPKGTK
jgi:hypothetical protein